MTISIKEAKRISNSPYLSATDKYLLGEAIRIIELQHKLLNELEGISAYQTDFADFCPRCQNSKAEGHAPDCKLDAALKEVGD